MNGRRSAYAYTFGAPLTSDARGDGPPLTPIVVPDSGAFSPPTPPRPIRLPSSAEAQKMLDDARRRVAGPAEIAALEARLARARLRETPVAPPIPTLPTPPRDDQGRPLQQPAPPPAARPPILDLPVTLPPPAARPPILDLPATLPPILAPMPPILAPMPPTKDVTDKAAQSVTGRLFKDVLTFAVLTSPAWLMLLLYPRRQGA